MLDATLTAQLSTYLGLLREPLELSARLDGSTASAQTAQLLAEIKALSPKISILEAPLDDDRAPSFGIARAGQSPRVRFAGLPLGHEFTSLVLALLHTSGHPPKISDEMIQAIKAIPGPLRFETFFSQSCHNCPDVVQAFNLMAALNPNITHAAIDGGSFQAEIESRGIMGVPAVLLNGESFGQGRMTIEEIVAKLDAGSAQRSAADLSAKEPFDMLIVGGGPAGAAAAVYGARKGIRVGVLADRFGGQTLDTLAIENFISVKETVGPKFAAALEEHALAYDVDIIKPHKAASISAPSQPGGLFEVVTESGGVLRAKTVILATGARWRSMNVPGEDEYRNKGVAYCPHCDGPLFKGKRVAVVGGGNSGVEAAIDLAGMASEVTLFEFAGALKADSVLQRKLASLPNARVVLNAETTEAVGDGSKITALDYRDRADGASHRVELEGIFVQIGLIPNTEWLPSKVERTRLGEIIVDARGQTSIPGLFAAGDATATPFKQIIIAAGEGAKAALGAFDVLMRQ